MSALSDASRALAFLDFSPAKHKTEEEHYNANKDEYLQSVRVVLLSVRSARPDESKSWSEAIDSILAECV